MKELCFHLMLGILFLKLSISNYRFDHIHQVKRRVLTEGGKTGEAKK